MSEIGTRSVIGQVAVTAGVLVGAFLLLGAGAGWADDRRGAWSSLADWPLIAIHAALTPDGRVLTYGSDQSGFRGADAVYDVWDPELGLGPDSHLTLPNGTGVDSFCSGQLILPVTGEIVTAGGNTVDGVNRYDYRDDGLRQTGTMVYGRWYGTLTTLPDGRLLAQGGLTDPSTYRGQSTTPEVFSEALGWQPLPDARDDEIYGLGGGENRWWYPRSFVAPDGRVFGITGRVMYYIDADGSGAIEEVGRLDRSNVGASSTAVMYAPGRILQVGGGGFNSNDDGLLDTVASNDATIIDINGSDPQIGDTEPMRYRRHWATSTVLPDGKVLVTGGSRLNNLLDGVANTAEIWDPASGAWTQGASGNQPRLYHSTALLLPDGRVLVAGGGSPGPLTNLDAELYSPPYLFDGSEPVDDRLVIDDAPAVLQVGTTFQIRLLSDDAVARVTLVKTGAVTHSYNMDQRFIELGFEQSGTDLTVDAPADSNVATPGRYLLFALDSAGIPSSGWLLDIDPASVN